MKKQPVAQLIMIVTLPTLIVGIDEANGLFCQSLDNLTPSSNSTLLKRETCNENSNEN